MPSNSLDYIKVAIVHYWLDGFRGGEKVVEAICQIFPHADIYTHICIPKNLPSTITSHKIRTTFIQKLPFASKLSRYYLPLMPLALRTLNLKEYDLIISSESGPAKGIIKRADALHICYCHSPMRYIWDMQKDYVRSFGFVARKLWCINACFMRKWDRWSSTKVDYFIANSKFISARIRKFYKRKSTVIYPPVDTHKYLPDKQRENFYLIVSQLVPYKKVDLVVEAFNKLGLPLIVIGDGPEMAKIKKLSSSNIILLGKVSDEKLKNRMETCKAFVYAGKEDFGIVFAEAQAAGAPIIALGKGGVKDIVLKNKTGVFFHKQDIETICKSVRYFEAGFYSKLSSEKISERAKEFSRELFINKMKEFIKDKIKKNS